MLRLSPFKFYYSGSAQKQPQLFSESQIDFAQRGLYLITGPSGSGKSTLLALIKGLAPYSIPGHFVGKIHYKDHLVDQEFVRATQNEVVYLFQNPQQQMIHQNTQLEFCFTAESQQLEYEVFAQEKKRLTEEFALSALWNKKTFELSLGEAQRLLLASLLASRPQVLLLDEPTAFMDQPARQLFYAHLQELKTRYLILLVDHHLSEVSGYADHVLAVGEDGCVQIKDTAFLTQLPSLKPDIAKSLPLESSEPYRIEFSQVNFSYRQGLPGLQNICFRAQSPDVVVIRGANGSGKSTFLKLLAGFLKPQKGTITHSEAKRRNWVKTVGYVMQNPEDNFLYDTAAEEVERTDPEVVQRFFNGRNLNVSPYSLSEGEKRRLSLLVHLNSEKKVILYDEPTFGLDEKNKRLVAESILKYKEKNILQIVVTHDDTFAGWIADRTYELRGGQLAET